MKKFSKSDLIDALSAKNEVTKVEAKKQVEDVLSTILQMAKEAGITINDFGTLKYKQRAARKARNPQTGSIIDIPACEALTFKVAKSQK